MTSPFVPLSPLIRLDHVHFAYGNSGGETADAQVLIDHDLSITQGESIAFIGPNGCGKSSLLKLFCGVHHPVRGQYLYRGREINARSLKDQGLAKAFRQDIGLVFQNPEIQLFCSRVDDEVAFGPRAMGLEENEVGQRVRDSLELLGITHLAEKTPFHLSGGEKRKVALAAILSINPSCLVLDEPMNGLDPRSKRALADLLLRLREAGKTILCSTHDFAYVEGIFSRVVVLGQDHRIVRDGPWEQIMTDHTFLADQNIE